MRVRRPRAALLGAAGATATVLTQEKKRIEKGDPSKWVLWIPKDPWTLHRRGRTLLFTGSNCSHPKQNPCFGHRVRIRSGKQVTLRIRGPSLEGIEPSITRVCTLKTSDVDHRLLPAATLSARSPTETDSVGPKQPLNPRLPTTINRLTTQSTKDFTPKPGRSHCFNGL